MKEPPPLATTQIDLLRHGECEGGSIFRGATDVGLSSAGLAAMHRVCAAVGEDWDIIISSPLKRCRLFARQLSEQRRIPLELESDLREMNFGEWEGCEIECIRQEDADRFQAWGRNPSVNTPPGGEPLHDVYRRTGTAHSKILRGHRSKKILLVSHGGIIRVLLAKLLDMPMAHLSRIDVPYASISRYAVYHAEDGDVKKMLAHNFIRPE